jgi:hypothetical protein
VLEIASVFEPSLCVYVAGSSSEFLLLVEGNPSEILYSNTVVSTWSGFSNVDSGATPSTPALAALV